MLRYQSRRHRQLMDASEYALHDATESESERESRIASTILQDDRHYRHWELSHANLLLPVAERSATKAQILELRRAEVHLIHRRALFKYLQAHEMKDTIRRKLFRLFHATRDYKEAILAEHRDYMLAVSSRISTDHIIGVMHDRHSIDLLRLYESAYARYFGMKCYVAMGHESNCTELIRSTMRDTEARLFRIRRRLETAPPSSDSGNFDREELLSRSGRYPALNYLNA